MRKIATAALAAAMMMLGLDAGQAGREARQSAPPAGEVLVFEIDGCGHCIAFRENLGARYLASTTNRVAPLRFVDLNRHDPLSFSLKADITTVPTIVLLKEGREVDRLEGYPLPELMFSMVKGHLGATADVASD